MAPKGRKEIAAKATQRKGGKAMHAWRSFASADSRNKIGEFLDANPKAAADVEKFCLSGVLEDVAEDDEEVPRFSRGKTYISQLPRGTLSKHLKQQASHWPVQGVNWIVKNNYDHAVTIFAMATNLRKDKQSDVMDRRVPVFDLLASERFKHFGNRLAEKTLKFENQVFYLDIDGGDGIFSQDRDAEQRVVGITHPSAGRVAVGPNRFGKDSVLRNNHDEMEATLESADGVDVMRLSGLFSRNGLTLTQSLPPGVQHNIIDDFEKGLEVGEGQDEKPRKLAAAAASGERTNRE